MDFCKLRSTEGPTGPFGIALPLKARDALASREISLFLLHRVHWVEDGLRVVIGIMLTGEGRVSDYLRLAYPETFAEHLRRTETDDTRRTLLFRLRYLLRCLGVVAAHYTEFRMWSLTGLQMTLDIFADCVRQAVGSQVGDRLAVSIGRFYRIWATVDHMLVSEEAVRRELQILLDDLDEVFEIMREAFREKEEELECSRRAAERAADEIAALRAAQEAANRDHRKALRRCERLAVAESGSESDGDYSRLAGLSRVTGAKLEELKACFRYSHEKFAVERGDRSGAHSLGRLAECVWRANRETFEAYARLDTDPGYKNVGSLAAKLYKLAARYPAAAHFRWRA